MSLATRCRVLYGAARVVSGTDLPASEWRHLRERAMDLSEECALAAADGSEERAPWRDWEASALTMRSLAQWAQEQARSLERVAIPHLMDRHAALTVRAVGILDDGADERARFVADARDLARHFRAAAPSLSDEQAEQLIDHAIDWDAWAGSVEMADAGGEATP